MKAKTGESNTRNVLSAPVTEDYRAHDNRFTGRILKVTVDVKPMGAGEIVVASKAIAEAAGKMKAAEWSGRACRTE